MLSRHRVGTYHGNELTRNSSKNACPQSFQLAEPLWADPGMKRDRFARADLHVRREKKAEAGNDSSS